jgi:hypothetical protein
MILRSVTKHVKEQNWFAVVLDLVIVVFGVFIGIQVSNWNQNLENKRIANNYIQRLEGDLLSEIRGFHQTINYFNITLSHANSALKGYKDPSSELNIDFLISHYQASQTFMLSEKRGAYDELLATGRIEFIDNEKIRKAITIYYESSTDRSDTLLRNTYLPYRELIRTQLDETIQMKIREHCSDQFIFGDDGYYYPKLPSTCQIAVSNSLVRQEVEKLLSSNNQKQALRFQQSALEIMIRSLNNGIKTAELTLNTLKGVYH